MRSYPSSMRAAPTLTLPLPIAQQMVKELLSRHHTSGWPPLGARIREQIRPGGTRTTITLMPTDLSDALVVLLELSIFYGEGDLTPERCGFTEGDVHETIDTHQHHLPGIWEE